ncbi:MAG: DUF2971 domain-containing protein [Bacteroidia bacterium]
MKINGWKYSAIQNPNSKLLHDFEIIPNYEIKKPDYLYKYYSLKSYNIEALTENYLYINHPIEFNDLYDCYEELISFDDEAIKSILINNPYTEEEFEVEKKKDSDIIHLQAQTRSKEMFFQRAGIVCFSEVYNNPLMWSYYNNNNGFLIEFDYSKFQFKFHGPFPIHYSEKIESVELSNYGLATSFLYQTNIKSKIWEHEKEWRIIVETSDEYYLLPSFKLLQNFGGKQRKEKYNLSSIKTLALGNRFFKPEEITILNDKKVSIKLDENDANYSLKKTLIEFCLKNNIPTAFCLRSKDFITLQFRTTKIILENGCYTFESIM